MKRFAWILAGCVVLGAVGCGKPAPVVKEAEHAHAEHADNDHEEPHHAHSPKYGGALVEVGEHVGQMEYVLDPATGKVTVYAMDGHAENPVRLPWTEFKFDVMVAGGAPIAVVASPVANPLTGETVGDTAQFEVVVAGLKGVSTFEVQVPAMEYRGVQVEPIRFQYPEGKP